MEPILVTGAGGFIGAHLVRALLAQGVAVRAGVRADGDNILRRMLGVEPPASLSIVEADLTDADAAARLIGDARTVVHLAGVTGPERLDGSMQPLFRGNVVATFNLLEAARKSPALERIVLASSSAAYGANSGAGIDEDQLARPGSVYSATKISMENLAESFFHSAGLPVVTLRLFNVYGPYQKAAAVVPTIISQVLETGMVRLGNLSPKRDFTHVEDIATAFIAAIAADATRVLGEKFNIGTGVATSIGDVAAMVFDQLGAERMIEVEDRRKRLANIDVDIVSANNAKARRLLGWRPATDLPAGLRSTIAWWQERVR